MLRWLRNRKIRRLEKQVADLQSDIRARDRSIAVLEAERDTMAQVIVRDRERVRAEMAVHVLKQSEGGNE